MTDKMTNIRYNATLLIMSLRGGQSPTWQSQQYLIYMFLEKVSKGVSSSLRKMEILHSLQNDRIKAIMFLVFVFWGKVRKGVFAPVLNGEIASTVKGTVSQ